MYNINSYKNIKSYKKYKIWNIIRAVTIGRVVEHLIKLNSTQLSNSNQVGPLERNHNISNDQIFQMIKNFKWSNISNDEIFQNRKTKDRLRELIIFQMKKFYQTSLFWTQTMQCWIQHLKVKILSYTKSSWTIPDIFHFWNTYFLGM